MRFGAIAQLGERYNGIVEVSGSIPLGSTKWKGPVRKSWAFFVNGHVDAAPAMTAYALANRRLFARTLRR
jgi:hypothetical protein